MQSALNAGLVGIVSTFQGGRGTGYEWGTVEDYCGVHYWFRGFL